MALFIRQNEDRSKLQERLSAELQERSSQRAKVEKDTSDKLEDSSFFNDTQSSSKMLWVWFLIFAAIFIIVGFMVYRGAVQ